MLRTENLSKTFDETAAVQDLSLHVKAGEIYGFLGPNGAGKTTTIRLLLGLLRPSAGKIFLFDSPVTDDLLLAKRRIGVVAEEPLGPTRMTAWEMVRFFADLNQVSKAEQRMEELFHKLNLWDARHALVAAYSRGMRQKLSLIRAMVHSPDLLILDEPVSGLDPYGILEVREVVEEHRANGGAVLISSHILSEIERSANRIGILHKGRLLAEDTISGLRRRIGGTTIVILELLTVPPALVDSLAAHPAVENLESNGHRLAIHTSAGQDARPEIFGVVVAAGGTIVEMRTQEMSLEEAFVTITHQNVEQLAGAA
jgi:ABC-2 type transport system ATP-binding protein